MPNWPTVDEIAAKVRNRQPLTRWESSVYRLNFRPDGMRYSADPRVREQQYDEDIVQTARSDGMQMFGGSWEVTDERHALRR